MVETKKKPVTPEKETGIVCPHCKEFIPEPVKNTLKLKITWYIDGKDPKKGAKPFDIVRYPNAPSVGMNLQFKDAIYQVTELRDTEAGEAAGFLKLVKAGSYVPIKTQIQDKTPEIIDKS